MNSAIKKSESSNSALQSTSRRSLLAICREIHFGRIEEFDIRAGEPILDPPPQVVREIKFSGENQTPSKQDGEIQLRNQTVDLFAWFDQLRDCHVRYLEVKHGLPFKMNILHEAQHQRPQK